MQDEKSRESADDSECFDLHTCSQLKYLHQWFQLILLWWVAGSCYVRHAFKPDQSCPKGATWTADGPCSWGPHSQAYPWWDWEWRPCSHDEVRDPYSLKSSCLTFYVAVWWCLFVIYCLFCCLKSWHQVFMLEAEPNIKAFFNRLVYFITVVFKLHLFICQDHLSNVPPGTGMIQPF